MTSADHVPDNRSLETSSKSAGRNMIKIIADGTGLAGFNQRLCCPATESREWLRTIPGHGLVLAARPARNAAYDFEHLPDAGLCFLRLKPRQLIESFPAKAD